MSKVRLSPAFEADEVLLEARDKSTRAEQYRHIVAGTAVERLAIHRALERNRHAVAVCRAFGLGDERAVLFGERLQRLIDLGVGDVGTKPLKLHGFEIHERNRRHDLHLDRVGEVGFAFDDALDGPFFRREHHLRLGGELKAVVAHDLVVGFAHRGFDHLGHGGFAVELLEVRDRHLAGAEAAQLHAALEIVEAFVDARLKVGCRDHDPIFALKARGASFGDLHWIYSSGLFAKGAARLVRAEGLEPPRLASREPKSRASTNSATPATRKAVRRRGLYHAACAGYYKNSHRGWRLHSALPQRCRSAIRQARRGRRPAKFPASLRRSGPGRRPPPLRHGARPRRSPPRTPACPAPTDLPRSRSARRRRRPWPGRPAHWRRCWLGRRPPQRPYRRP